MSWALEAEKLRSADFNDDEILEEASRERSRMTAAGFSKNEIDEFFGTAEPDLSVTESKIRENIQKSIPAEVEEPNHAPSLSSINMTGVSPTTPPSPNIDEVSKPTPRVVDSFLGALEAGWETSSLNALVEAARDQSADPEAVLADDAPMFYRIASMVSEVAADLPAMTAGALLGGSTGAAIGGVVGSAVAPGPGTIAGTTAGAAIGAGAGGNAAPTLIREAIMEFYEKNPNRDFKDFWPHFSAVTLKTLKSAAIGGATGGVGSKVAGIMARRAASPVIASSARAASEIATMTAVGSALEGQLPKAQDILDAGVLVGGLTGATHVASKLRKTYAKTGARPSEVAMEAQVNPSVKQDLLALGTDLPDVYASGSEKVTKLNDGVATRPLEMLSSDTEPVGLKMPQADPTVELPPSKIEAGTPQAEILSRIVPSDVNGKPKNITLQRLYTDFVDDLNPVKQLVDSVKDGTFVAVKDDPYKLLRMGRGDFARGEAFIKYGPSDFHTLKSTGKGLETILKPLGDDLDGFRAYAVAKRAAEDLHPRGIETGINLEAASKVIEAGAPKFDKVLSEFVDYRNKTLKYVKDSGIISEDAYQKMLAANKNAVPFYRLLDERSSALKTGNQVSNPLKRIEGSERPIIDPIESTIKDTFALTQLAERNRAMRALVDLAQKTETGRELVSRVKPPVEELTIKHEEVARFLRENGIDESNAEAFSVFRAKTTPLPPDQIAVYRDGKREIYRVPKEVGEAINRVDGETASLLVQILSLPAKGLRVGMVLDPIFQVKNLSRDTLAAFVYSPGAVIPGVNTLRGFTEAFRKGRSFEEWQRAGGSNATMLQLDREFVHKNIFKLSQETGLLDKTLNVVKSPIELLKVFGELMENSNRLGRYKADRTRGLDPFEAAYNSREGTLDFGRIGAKMRAANSLIAFLNVHVQGWDRLARSMKDDPVGTNTRLITAITLPSILLYLANKDDPRYADLSTVRKRMFFNLMTDDWQDATSRETASTAKGYKRQLPDGRWQVNKGVIYSFPKPPEFGMLYGTLPEMLLERWSKDRPQDFAEFSASALKMLTPSVLPQVLTTPVEQFTNKSFFSGRKLIPGHLEGIAPRYQYTPYTTETGKMLGRMIGAVPGLRDTTFSSPVVIENYFRSWGGKTGTYFLQLTEKALQAAGLAPEVVKPLSKLNENPFVNSFVMDFPLRDPQSLQDFYDNAEKAETNIKTIRHLAKSGNISDLEKEATFANMELSLSGMRASVSKQAQAIHNIYKTPTLTPTEKRQLIDGLLYGMTETAKAGNEMVRKFEEIKRSGTKDVSSHGE